MGTQDLVLRLVLASAVLAAVCTAQSCPTFQNGCHCSTYTSGVRILLDVDCYGAELTSFPELPEDIQGNVGRLYLYGSIAGNHLTEIPADFFANMTQLQILYLSGNDIGYIEAGTFSTVTQLEVLYLDDNDIGYIEPGTFSTTTQLRRLRLNGNDLTEIPDNLFANLTQLQALYLYDNDIGYIALGTFSTTTQLRELRLDRNNLMAIPDNLFANLTQLELLYLYENDIEYIEPGTFSTTTQLRYLDLRYNPLHCDCRLSWIPSYIQANPNLNIDSGICDAPESVRGRPVDSLREEEFICVSLNVNCDFCTHGTGNEYTSRAASFISVTCVASGGTPPYTYDWGDTSLPAVYGPPPEPDRRQQDVLRSTDNGGHTCTVRDSTNSIIGNATITLNVVGIGIVEFRGTQRITMPNNGLLVTLSAGTRFHFRCHSESTQNNVGMFLGLNGNCINSVDNDPFEFNPCNPGGFKIINNAGGEPVLTSNEQGVYTCRLPDTSSGNLEFNIGIYPFGFNSAPSIDSISYNEEKRTFTCVSSGSPATTVTWKRNGSPVTIDGTDFTADQTVTNRVMSTYTNTLTVEATATDFEGLYICNVSNLLGSAESAAAAMRPSAYPTRQVGDGNGCPTEEEWATARAAVLQDIYGQIVAQFGVVPSPLIGETAEAPATSCQQIAELAPASPSDYYWILSPDSDEQPVQMFCTFHP